MKKVKIVISLLIILVLMFTLSTKTFAAGSFSASLTPSSTRVGKGEEVTVTFKVSGINVEGGLAAILATLRFDSDVLSISKDDVVGTNGWQASYTEESKKITFDRSDVVTSDSEVATLKFKVNSSTSATTAAIQFVSISAGNADIDEEVKISDITTNISIGSSIISSPTTSPSNSPSTSPSGSPSGSPSNTGTNSPSISPSANNTQTASPTAPSTGNGQTTTKDDNAGIPKTGAENYIIPLMVVIAGLAVVSFICYKRIDSK